MPPPQSSRVRLKCTAIAQHIDLHCTQAACNTAYSICTTASSYPSATTTTIGRITSCIIAAC